MTPSVDTLPRTTPTGLASSGDYVALMKPRVMSLVVFTALVGYVAAPGQGDWVLGAAAIFALACGAGAAGALNMWYDADIDASMRRTRGRPVPAGKIPRDEALALGLVIGALSVLVMTLAGGVLAAGLLAFTIFFYAVVYTMWLKRRTPQNIVIGGLAGALPPAIAWAAKLQIGPAGFAAAALDPLAALQGALDPLILVGIIFLWTPPHFWALSLYLRGDYAAAGVPMLPVTHGPAHTRAAILGYSLVLTPIALLPALTGLGGLVYAAVAGVGGLLFLGLAVRVWASRAGEAGAVGDQDLYAVKQGDRAARDLFAFSILYLFGLFATLLGERLVAAWQA